MIDGLLNFSVTCTSNVLWCWCHPRGGELRYRIAAKAMPCIAFSKGDAKIQAMNALLGKSHVNRTIQEKWRNITKVRLELSALSLLT